MQWIEASEVLMKTKSRKSGGRNQYTNHEVRLGYVVPDYTGNGEFVVEIDGRRYQMELSFEHLQKLQKEIAEALRWDAATRLAAKKAE
jgi:hypothetical protein